MGSATVGPVVPLGSLGVQAVAGMGAASPTLIAASGAVNPHVSANYFITKAGVAALTLGPPTKGADDGVVIAFYSTTANAHTITTPTAGNIVDGNSSGNNTVMTFNAKIGANCGLRAYQGVWYVEQEVGCSLTS